MGPKYFVSTIGIFRETPCKRRATRRRLAIKHWYSGGVLARLFTRLFAALGVLIVLVTIFPQGLGWWARILAGPWNDPKGDILIVLGADVQSDGTLGPESYWRAVYAARTWREGGFQKTVVSGGASNGYSIATPIRDFLICQGVPASAIAIENRATSTRENALYVRDLLSGTPGRKVLITSDYHMFRAARCFRKVGMDIAPRPFPDALKRINSWTARWDVFLTLSEETVKIVYYRLHGWI